MHSLASSEWLSGRRYRLFLSAALLPSCGHWGVELPSVLLKSRAMYRLQNFDIVDTRYGEFFNLPNRSGRTTPWGLLSL
jgi:hypothetical protein